MPETIKTPANIPRISRVVKFWPYRTWSPAPAMVTALMAKIEDLRAVDDFRETLAAITSPACPHAHVANHTTWEVVLQRGGHAAVWFHDGICYVYRLPVSVEGER